MKKGTMVFKDLLFKIESVNGRLLHSTAFVYLFFCIRTTEKTVSQCIVVTA